MKKVYITISYKGNTYVGLPGELPEGKLNEAESLLKTVVEGDCTSLTLACAEGKKYFSRKVIAKSVITLVIED